MQGVLTQRGHAALHHRVFGAKTLAISAIACPKIVECLGRFFNKA
jgi:hypothetical protein